MKRVFHWSSISCILLCLHVFAASQPDTNTSFTVHFTVPPNIGAPVIEMTFSNGFVGRFLLDTTTTHTLVSTEVASKLQATPHPITTDDGKPFVMNGEPGQGIDVHNVKIGEFNIANFTFVVVKPTEIPWPIDGVMGLNFFAHFSTFLDYGTHSAKFWFNTSPTAGERSALGLSGAVALPLISDPVPYFNVRAKYNNSKDENVVISTSAVESRISESLARALKLHAVTIPEHQNNAEGAVKFSEAIIDRLELGALVVKNPTIMYITDPGVPRGTGYPDCIARDILLQCRILFDVPAHICYIKPLKNTTPSKATEAGKSIIDMAAIAAYRLPPFTAALSKEAPYGLPIIEIKLGGRYIGKFLIDSGTPVSLLTDSVSDVLRLPRYPTPTEDGKPLIFLDRTTECITVPDVTIGGQDTGDHLFVLTKRSDLPLEIDGILGGNFMEVYSSLFDFGSHTVTFWNNSSPTAAERAAHGMAGAVSVPMAPVQPNAFKIHARYNQSIDEEVVVDTGAGTSQISSELAAKLKLQPTSTNGQAAVLGGTTPVSMAVVHQFAIGSVLVKDLTVQYPTAAGPRTVPQCVGMDVLSHYRVLIDSLNKIMYLKALRQKK